jgi:hypothetical protein
MCLKTSKRWFIKAVSDPSYSTTINASPLFLRPVHKTKHRVPSSFPLKIGEWGSRGHVKVWRDKRHQVVFREKQLENRCSLSHLKLDGADRFGATPGLVGEWLSLSSHSLNHAGR